MADAPKSSNHRGVSERAMTRDNRRDGDDVVGIGSVAHPEKKTKRDDGEQADHRTDILNRTRGVKQAILAACSAFGRTAPEDRSVAA